MRADDPRVLAVATAILALVDAFAGERPGDTADELIAFPFGLERRAASDLARSGRIPTVRLGRRTFTRRSALIALVGPSPSPAAALAAPPVADPASAAREAYSARPLRMMRGGSR